MATRHLAVAIVGLVLVLLVGACTAAATTTTVPTVPASLAVASSSPVEPSLPAQSSAPSSAVAPTEPPAPSVSHRPLPSIDQTELDTYLTSSVTLVDLADDDLSVAVSYLDPESKDAFDLGTYDLSSTEQMTDQVPPGTYQLVFRQGAGTTAAQTCTVEIGDADAFTFAAIPGAVAISRTGTKPKTADELFVATSSLCGN